MSLILGAKYSGVASYSPIQLKTMGSSSPDLSGLIHDSTPANNEVRQFPVTERGMVEENVEELKKVFNSRVEPDNQLVHEQAVLLASKYPEDNTIGQISSIYSYLKSGDGKQNGWSYLPNPRDEAYFSYANETLKMGKAARCAGIGDSYDFAILMSALVEAAGGTTRIILAYNNTTGGHAYAEAYLGQINAPNDEIENIVNWLKKKYNATEIYTHVDMDTKDVWLNLDWWPDEKGNSHPGGPFYQGDRYEAISIRDSYARNSLKGS